MKYLLAAVLLCLLVSCSRQASQLKPSPGELLKQPLNPATGSESKRFTALGPESTGVDFVNRLQDKHMWGAKLLATTQGSMGSGVCVADIDQDDLPDLFVCGKTGGGRLFKQTAPFKFADVTADAGIKLNPRAWNAGAGFVDIDGDGDMDLYICRHRAANLLYINQGNGKFEEQAKRFGLNVVGASVMGAFCDYDRDGDMDMYLVTNRRTPTQQVYADAMQRLQSSDTLPAPMREYLSVVYYTNADGTPRREIIGAGQRDLLFRNDGDRFTEVAVQSGIEAYEMGHHVSWFDYNGDQWPDVYVSNDFYGKDRLYENLGDGSFEDVTKDVLPHTPWYSMGSDFADVNRDGRFDLFAADMSATTHLKQKVNMGDMKDTWFLNAPTPRQYMRNALYLNVHSERFMEIAHLAGVDSTDWTWSAKFGDLDNDGWSDLYVTNGMLRNFMDADLNARIDSAVQNRGPQAYADELKSSPKLKEHNLAFRNVGGLKFKSSGDQWGLDHLGISYAAAFADLDRDGDLDIITNHFDEPVGIYRNNTVDTSAILVKLRGSVSHPIGYGAVVKVTTDSGTQTAMLSQTRGYMASDDPVLHFGLGSDQSLNELQIIWPSGLRQQFQDLEVGYCYTVGEPDGPIDRPPAGSGPDSQTHALFSDHTHASGLQWSHSEDYFDDYAQQPLLPYQLSMLGPGVAVSDVNDDGIDDVFVAGGNGSSGQLLLGEAGGTFREQSGPWESDAASEDLAPLLLDVDSDGDVDLFVTSGGVEFGADSPLLSDRLYLNHGDGTFSSADAGRLLDLLASSSCAAAADFDRDGDLDLFVGGRVEPGKYPLAGESRLLLNEGGRFTDATGAQDAELARVGMVTSSLWSDADGDGWVDLLVATEWGQVHLFKNDAGMLKQATEDAGLDEVSGWFNSLIAADFNADGQMDYVVGNVGLNTKYKATSEAPAVLYYGDFGGTGEIRCVEAGYKEGRLLPLRGKSCSTNAMPHLAERFKTYRSFGEVDLFGAYGQTELDEAERFEANELAHLLLLNLGDGRFEVSPLPRLAQAAPVFGMAAADMDADGHVDLILGQNFYAPQAETGRYDGGVSLMLRGDGKGGFEPLDPNQSGIMLSGDTKGMALCDSNNDGWPDIVVAQNAGPLKLFRHNTVESKQPFVVRLVGATGNQDAVGARVEYWVGDELIQVSEISAGAGYLSQSTSNLFFVRRGGRGKLKVHWPSGDVSEHDLDEGRTIEITQPASDNETASVDLQSQRYLNAAAQAKSHDDSL